MSKKQTRTRNLLTFAMSGLLISAIVTICMIIYVYKDIIYLRFFSGFVSDTSTSGFRSLLIDGLASNLRQDIAERTPYIALLVGGCLFIYSVVHGFRKTAHLLTVNTEYINVKKQPTAHLVSRAILSRVLAVNIPILFWGFYIFLWFPVLVKLPLKYLASSMTQLGIITLAVVCTLTLITQLGVVTTRLSARYITRG